MWNDRRASEYLEQARIILDIGERARLYKNFQVRFYDQLPALPLYYPVYTYGVSSDVKGVRIGPIFEPSDRLETISDWYFFVEVPVDLLHMYEIAGLILEAEKNYTMLENQFLNLSCFCDFNYISCSKSINFKSQLIIIIHKKLIKTCQMNNKI